MSACIVWFRYDLRLDDNPALDYALRHAERVVPLYIHAPEEHGDWAPGAASQWWLHHSLRSLAERLGERGSRLIIRPGPSRYALTSLIAESGADEVCWNRVYEPALIRRDKKIKAELREQGIACHSFNGALLFEPWSVKTKAGGPFRVFTPFWRACLESGIDPKPRPRRKKAPSVDSRIKSPSLETLQLLPRISWDEGLKTAWRPGEQGALGNLQTFLDQAVPDYSDGRDVPAERSTTRLSPHLHFGEIGPRRIVSAVRQRMEVDRTPGVIKGGEALIRELGWREFAHHILYHFPHTAEEPLNERFAGFPWRENFGPLLEAWRAGRTGYPIVDAGMRELWRTGWMHNRVRMIAASLLTKNCRVPWQLGARWFWDTLVDADLAANSLGWQWVAGSGADAAPYFRIFNPVRQGEKFDPDGKYVRRWVPELAPLRNRWLHAPWTAPLDTQRKLAVEIGRHYPRPVVDFAQSREEALRVYREGAP